MGGVFLGRTALSLQWLRTGDGSGPAALSSPEGAKLSRNVLRSGVNECGDRQTIHRRKKYDTKMRKKAKRKQGEGMEGRKRTGVSAPMSRLRVHVPSQWGGKLTAALSVRTGSVCILGTKPPQVPSSACYSCVLSRFLPLFFFSLLIFLSSYLFPFSLRTAFLASGYSHIRA